MAQQQRAFKFNTFLYTSINIFLPKSCKQRQIVVLIYWFVFSLFIWDEQSTFLIANIP